jgi:hypothetical protein
MPDPLPNNPIQAYTLMGRYTFADNAPLRFLYADSKRKNYYIYFEGRLDLELYGKTYEDVFYIDMVYNVHLSWNYLPLTFLTKTFDNKQRLLEEINKQFKIWDIEFVLEENYLILSKLPKFLDIDVSELQFILGFQNRILTKPNIKASFPIQLKRGIYSFFIYLNICKHIMVGDTMVPLLRSVNVDSNELKDIVTRIIDSPVFIPISYTSFKTLEVQICDDKGELVPFGNDVNTQLLIEFRLL